MSLGPAQKNIGGHGFELSLLPTSMALNFLARLAKLVGPMLVGQAAQSGDAGGAAIAALFQGLHPQDLDQLVRTLLASCLMDGKPLFGPNGGAGGVYDSAFQGNLALLFQVVGWALQENLGDFSGLLSMVRERVQAMTAQRIQQGGLGLGSTPTSSPTGPSSA